MTYSLPAVTIFFGSFLLFVIQPLLGRTLLPSFGGTAAVWTVCLAAYQTLLLAGYFYAHLITGRRFRVQRLTHTVLLVLAVVWAAAFAFFRPALKGAMGNSGMPALEVLFCVLVCAGLPYVMLSAGSTLVQVWVVRPEGTETFGAAARETGGAGGRSVYRLYAISNLGSLSGLLVYPFLVEPFVALRAQWYGFAACLLIYTVLVARVARGSVKSQLPLSGEREPPGAELLKPASASGLPSPLARPWLWVALPALSAFALNAVTMHLTTDVTPAPMLWVLLLTAFLLSYVIGFSVAGEKGVIVWAGLGVLALAMASFANSQFEAGAILPDLLVSCGVLALCCTFLHGWLYRIRPEAAKLTRYYLGIAAGGALGGVSASLVAPLLFSSVWEYPLALMLLAGAAAWFIRSWRHPELKGLNGVLQGVCAVAILLVLHASLKGRSQTVLRDRNFYGCLSVTSHQVKTTLEETGVAYQLRHGATLHGMQVHLPRLRKEPTSYYGPAGGGLALSAHPKFTNGIPMRVGLIGLGVGTLACYGRTNDLYRFYEINPDVVKTASNTNYFTYLADSAATIEIKLGDARKSLEAELRRQEPRYDVLVVDAYSGDAIPYHLATKEAFHLYRDRLAPEGVLAVHVSNWHIDLLPLCKAMAKEIELDVTGILSRQTELTNEAVWVLMKKGIGRLTVEDAVEINWEEVRPFTVPTDERGSLVRLIGLNSQTPLQRPAFNFDAVLRPR
jgi:hypothetical protein